MKEELIKQFIKEMSNKLGDIGETINKVSADCYPKEKALGGMVKVHLVQAYNLLVQLEESMKEGSACKITQTGPEYLNQKRKERLDVNSKRLGYKTYINK